MIRGLLRRIFHPATLDADVSSDEERAREDERQREITARLERLRLEAERPALRRIYEHE